MAFESSKTRCDYFGTVLAVDTVPRSRGEAELVCISGVLSRRQNGRIYSSLVSSPAESSLLRDDRATFDASGSELLSVPAERSAALIQLAHYSHGRGFHDT